MPIPQCDEERAHTEFLESLIPDLKKELDQASLGPWITKNIAPVVAAAGKDLAIAGRNAGTMDDQLNALVSGLKGLLAAAYCKDPEKLAKGGLGTFQNKPKKPKKSPKKSPKKDPKKGPKKK